MSAPGFQNLLGCQGAVTAGESGEADTSSTTSRFNLETRGAAAPSRRGRSGRRERYYVGRRPQATEVYVVSGPEPERLPHPGYRSSARFDWGAEAPGALELAFAILADAAERRPTDLVCRAFCIEVVARLDQPGFVLTDGDIAVWLLSALVEPGYSAARPPAARGLQRASTALAWIRSVWRRPDR